VHVIAGIWIIRNMYIALHTAPQKIVASSCILMTSACFMCFKIGETQKLMVPTEIGDWQVISTHLDHTHMCWPSFGKSPFCCSLYSPVFPFLQCQGQSSCKLLGPGVPCLLQETRSIVEILKQVYISQILTPWISKCSWPYQWTLKYCFMNCVFSFILLHDYVIDHSTSKCYFKCIDFRG